MSYPFFDKATISVWIPLIGFDRELPDKGVGNLLDRMRFRPQAISLLTCHIDTVNHYEGLEKEYTLHPDICSYHASPRNEERNRQDWTNWDLKSLADNLNKEGIETYLCVGASNSQDLFHREFASDHPELLQYMRYGKYSINVLKRFKDGTWYEDFFADKICRLLTECGFTGLHVMDNFCPGAGGTYSNDYSLDMLEQFSDRTGIPIPPELLALGDDDSEESSRTRGDWLWEYHRQAWIEFHAWRWEGFWKKICARLHAIGKKTFVLGMYCTDPFQTLYVKGVDLRRIVNAGVDSLMPNVAASGSAIGKKRPWRYYEMSTMIPLTDVFEEKAQKLNMLGVKDGTEEWDMLHHASTLLERDIYYLASYFRHTPQGLKRCLDGYNVCLGDGIYADEWKWLKERFDIAFGDIPEKILLPTVVWSDTALYNTLPEFIDTRRWTLHKFMVELAKSGTQLGAMVRTEHLSAKCGDLFVPNFDLLSEAEKRQIAAYRDGAVICTASAEKPLDLAAYGIAAEISFDDPASPYKNRAFAFNLEVKHRAEILAALAERDDGLALEDPFHTQEVTYPSFRNDFPYQKVSAGFVKALGLLLKECASPLVEATMPILPMQMADGRLRIYGINDDRLHYDSCFVTVHRDIREVKNISKFPMLPVKFSDSGNFSFTTTADPKGMHTFKLLIPQGGISIVDVYMQ